ncbi:MAG: methylenetetrahydrofolate--tRNA-(uracil(54)-C(5))-methyltransferase (FADH(2)-oxidizing) TrmFO [Clostridiales bacterium]|nr:methylenetetrahydrofolate--tRNA-(uracil(54)-C(5))-methyltransferase (FADH(2)-oxidizing) TrmFO [Clostridiales bacterium]
MEYVNIIGGGLAGCEAAYQLAKRGIKVRLYEMKPNKYSPAHSNNNLAEIVCSNSFKSDKLTNACGLLKEELRQLDSLLIKCADKTKVPAGQALAVDRDNFANLVTQKISEFENIKIIREEVTSLPEGKTIIATGPLTSESFSNVISKIIGKEYLSFYDAAAPIVTYDSIDKEKVFRADRYGKGDSDYINCPMTDEEYARFYTELINAEIVEKKDFEKGNLFEGCMPIEEMARRGEKTLLFGMLKPVGFDRENRPCAVVQLRQDNEEGTLFNLVGFQTNLKFGEQKRVFSLIPGLENAEFVRYGVMHRNTYINSPEILDNTFNLINNKDIYFAGQITGVEGYVESIASGLIAGINMAHDILGKDKFILEDITILGALTKYISTPNKDFQPMNANFGIIRPLDIRIKDKVKKYEVYAEKSLEYINKMKELIL